jgi:hypothetical protein
MTQYIPDNNVFCLFLDTPWKTVMVMHHNNNLKDQSIATRRFLEKTQRILQQRHNKHANLTQYSD